MTSIFHQVKLKEETFIGQAFGDARNAFYDSHIFQAELNLTEVIGEKLDALGEAIEGRNTLLDKKARFLGELFYNINSIKHINLKPHINLVLNIPP